MVGPSSSHTAGAVRIGFVAQKLLGEPVKRARIGLYGSFLATGTGHGTQKALIAGLLGMVPDDMRIPDSFHLAEEKGIEFSFEEANLKEAHPNSAELELEGISGRSLTVVGESLGGSRINIAKVDGIEANFSGSYLTLVVHNDDQPGHVADVTARKLLEFGEALERDNYIQAVSREYFINYEDLRRLVNQLGSRYGVGEVGGSVGSTGAVAENRGAGNAEFPGNAGPAVRPVGRKKEKDEGIRRSERLLLTWLIEEPSLYARIKDIIGPEDFVKPLYKEAAKAVFEGLEAGNVNPAAILNRFIDDEGNYKEVAALFNASLEESLNNEEQKKAFAETVRRIKKNSLDDQIRRASDLNELQRLIREQAGLSSLVITLE